MKDEDSDAHIKAPVKEEEESDAKAEVKKEKGMLGWG